MLLRLALAVLLLLAPVARAQPGGSADAVAAAIRLPEVVEVLRQEGLDYGHTLETQLFPGEGGASWRDRVAAIYDAPRLQAGVLTAFRKALPATEVPAILAFFDSPLGRRVVSLELSARQAMLAPDVTEMARQTWAAMQEADDPRVAALQAFAADNGLVEADVADTLNSNLAFYHGLVEGHAKGFDMTEAQILHEVAGQAGAVRSEIEDWLYPYLALAYEPLSDADLAAYSAFGRSPAGRALNAALAQAFDGVFDGVSHDLGREAARYLSGPAL